MTPEQFLDDIITPGLERLHDLGGPAVTDDAKRIMLAIAQQESGPSLSARYQSAPSTTPGPARGFWQFEQGGGVAGVLSHAASKPHAEKLCNSCVVHTNKEAVWRSLEGHDDLSVGFARLLLFTDPRPLPTTEQDGWDYYIRNWRPGKPHPDTWHRNWENAQSAVRRTLG